MPCPANFHNRERKLASPERGDSPRGGEMSRRDRGDGHLLGVPDRTVTQNPQSKTKAPERGCGSYSRCVAPVRRSFVSSEWFSPFSQMPPHRAAQGLLFRWCMIHKKVPKFHRFFCMFSGLLSLRKYGNIQLPKGKNNENWRKKQCGQKERFR